MATANLGKHVAKLASKDPTGHTANTAEHLKTLRTMVTKTKPELEEVAKKGDKTEKYYAKMELDRRGSNKSLVKDLKKKQAEGKLTPKQVANRTAANKQRTQTSEQMREEVQQEYDRVMLPFDEDDGYAKGGAVKKKPMAYAKGGMVKAACGASVPPSGGKGKK